MRHLLAGLDRLLKQKIRKSADREWSAQILRPLYAAAAGRSYRLVPAGALDAGDAGTAIAVATGLRGATVDLSSASIADASLLAGTATSRLGDLVRDRSCLDLRALLGDALLGDLDEHAEEFDAHLEEAVWDAVWERLPQQYDGKPFLDVRYGIRTAVRAYLGRTLAGDVDGGRSLRPLVRLVTGAIPLGESAATGRWHVLVR